MGRGRSKHTIALVQAAYEILAEIQPASVRAVCYKLFVRQLIPSMLKQQTDKVSGYLVTAREEGVIPWEWIVDETRPAEYPGTWNDPEHFAEVAMRSFRRDRWQQQDTHVEVWSEKSTIGGTVGPILKKLGVTFRVFGGYSSATKIKDIADMSLNIEKPFVALYMGDWDPSGLHIDEVYIPDKLGKHGAAVEIKRIALVASDLTCELSSFPLLDKETDTRFHWFASRTCEDFGLKCWEFNAMKCWELDAMDPRILRQRVEAEILRYINQDAWDRCQLAEDVEQSSLRTVLTNWHKQMGAGPQIGIHP